MDGIDKEVKNEIFELFGFSTRSVFWSEPKDIRFTSIDISYSRMKKSLGIEYGYKDTSLVEAIAEIFFDTLPDIRFFVLHCYGARDYEPLHIWLICESGITGRTSFGYFTNQHRDYREGVEYRGSIGNDRDFYRLGYFGDYDFGVFYPANVGDMIRGFAKERTEHSISATNEQLGAFYRRFAVGLLEKKINQLNLSLNALKNDPDTSV